MLEDRAPSHSYVSRIMTSFKYFDVFVAITSARKNFSRKKPFYISAKFHKYTMNCSLDTTGWVIFTPHPTENLEPKFPGKIGLAITD